MTRKTKMKAPRPKVTAAVKEPIVKTTMPEIIDAMDFATEVGVQIGRVEGMVAGRRAPRTEGEIRVQQQKPAIANILQEVFIEAQSAVRKHGPMHSGHEGFAVIKEELDELWDEIKADRGKQASARAEAIQVAAMAVRYALDINPR